MSCVNINIRRFYTYVFLNREQHGSLQALPKLYAQNFHVHVFFACDLVHDVHLICSLPLITHILGDMERMSQACTCNNHGPTISTKKTEIVHQPAPGKPYNEPTISDCKLVINSSI